MILLCPYLHNDLTAAGFIFNLANISELLMQDLSLKSDAYHSCIYGLDMVHLIREGNEFFVWY